MVDLHFPRLCKKALFLVTLVLTHKYGSCVERREPNPVTVEVPTETPDQQFVSQNHQIYGNLFTFLLQNKLLDSTEHKGRDPVVPPMEILKACERVITEIYGKNKTITDSGEQYCNVSWDQYSCWPATPGGTYAVIPCPGYLEGIDVASNATKFCNDNGTWAPKAAYNNCVGGSGELESWDIEDSHSTATRYIYNVGFTLSTLTLAIALFIFLYFRSLRCLRNIIHCHLIVTFILKNVIWIIMQHSLIPIRNSDHLWLCKLEVTLFNYSQGTNFFWMFVEGLYLHIIIVWTYSADKIRMWYLLVIGWGMPAVFVIAWTVVKKKLQDVDCWLPDIHGKKAMYDFIFIGPILFVLFVNILFLSSIIWILITKLRATYSWELRQYRKAVKATIILIPPLGVTYVLFITPPSDGYTVKTVFQYINAVLQSFQGFFVAVFYCFLNGEVRSVLKKKFNRFNDARSLSTKFTKTSVGWTRGSRSSRDFGQSIALSNGNATVTAENRKTTENAWKNEDHEDPGEAEEMLDT